METHTSMIAQALLFRLSAIVLFALLLRAIREKVPKSK